MLKKIDEKCSEEFAGFVYEMYKKEYNIYITYLNKISDKEYELSYFLDYGIGVSTNSFKISKEDLYNRILLFKTKSLNLNQ